MTALDVMVNIYLTRTLEDFAGVQVSTMRVVGPTITWRLICSE
jgi:hypothetical protein